MNENDTIRDYLTQWADDGYAPVDEVNDAMAICVGGGVDRQLAQQVLKVALYIKGSYGNEVSYEY